MASIHTLGYPRIGRQRELKRLLEDFWHDRVDQDALLNGANVIREQRWREQAAAGLDFIPVNDFSLYDHVLDMSALLGVVPPRFGQAGETADLETCFRMARGDASQPACEMTKWFDTNYHYLVPEFEPDQVFRIASSKLFEEVAAARAQQYRVKPVLIGPLTYLRLGKRRDGGDVLELLPRLLPVYLQILERLAEQGMDWVQIDEPCLVQDLDDRWRKAYEQAYTELAQAPVRLLLATYFGGLGDNLFTVLNLPVAGLHVDAVRAPGEVHRLLEYWPTDRVLSLGVIDGRNVWRADLDAILDRIEPIHARFGNRLWLAPSCSLLHTPLDVELETDLDPELRQWLAFARQKLDELAALRRALTHGRRAISQQRRESTAAHSTRQISDKVRRPEVQAQLLNIDTNMIGRSQDYRSRAEAQAHALQLPLLPTTTIGSFPQTATIRRARADFRAGSIDEQAYHQAMQSEIESVIRKQEKIGLDVLVHGEPERNDMVEYFGEQLEGVAVTRYGWVQSYGSRCVKPPIIYGDVVRPQPMTVDWAQYAQSLTDKPVKGMLTGPVTILQWSFVRDDQPRAETCLQLALVLRDEVTDLEAAGIRVIQVDEPALREGLPLREAEQGHYLNWAVRAFKLATSAVEPATQIHTHMCYAEFEDVLPAIAAMDADVITLENARSSGALMRTFEQFEYPNAIGPGVWDIHSPRVPEVNEISSLLQAAARVTPVERLWVNPDCGLKTRGWTEVEAALENMLSATRQLREELHAASVRAVMSG